MSTVNDVRARLKFSPRTADRSERRTRVRAQASTGTLTLTWSLTTVGVLALWILVYALGLSRMQEQHAQANLYSSFRSQLAQATAPLGGTITAGSPVAVLDSSKAGLHDLVVVQGSASSQLRSGPGHYPASVLPGQVGFSEVMGKAATYGAPFRDIGKLSQGDTITATTGQGVFSYVVLDVRRAGDPVPAPVSSTGSRLTLVTSEGSGWRSGWAPTHVLFVDADLKGKAQPSPSGQSLSSTADAIMKPDLSNLYPMILWLQLLLLVAVGVVWAAIRWGTRQIWIVGTPVILLGLWGTTNCVAQFVPNLI